jgi:ABC-type transport system substrate-binding protein
LYDSYEAAKLAFELGEADIIDIAPYDVKRFEDHYEVLAESLESALFLSVNNSKPYFSDNLFSTALNYLIDKESLCRVPLGQMVAPIDYPVELPGDEMSIPFSYDRRKGRKLMRQVEDLPKYLSLFVSDPGDPAVLRTAQYIRGVLKREGISVTIYTEEYEGGEPEDSTVNTSFDMMLARLDDLTGSRAGILYQSFYHEDFEQSLANRSLFHSTECESAFQEFYSSCFESTEAGMRAARRIIYKHLNAPSGVWIYRPIRYIAVSPRVTMPAFLPGGIVDLSGIKADGQ